MLDGVTIAESKAQKDELVLEGNDVENVSQSGIFTADVEKQGTDRFPQPPPFKVAAEFGTRIFVNSSTVSMFQSGRQWSRTKMSEWLGWTVYLKSMQVYDNPPTTLYDRACYTLALFHLCDTR